MDMGSTIGDSEEEEDDDDSDEDMGGSREAGVDSVEGRSIVVAMVSFFQIVKLPIPGVRRLRFRNAWTENRRQPRRGLTVKIFMNKILNAAAHVSGDQTTAKPEMEPQFEGKTTMILPL